MRVLSSRYRSRGSAAGKVGLAVPSRPLVPAEMFAAAAKGRAALVAAGVKPAGERR